MFQQIKHFRRYRAVTVSGCCFDYPKVNRATRRISWLMERKAALRRQPRADNGKVG
jgi:hypothetical protein